jgi:hypothetical protein
LYASADPEEWVLISKIPGDDGFNREEIKYRDIPSIITDYFFLALAFWKRCKKYPPTYKDSGELTIAQYRLIGLFDELWNMRQANGN